VPSAVSRNRKTERLLVRTVDEEVWDVLLLMILAVVVVVAFGIGFAVHWLFVIAVIAALIWLISFFLGGARGRSRSTWW
jgi:predicted membrane protein